LVGVWFVDWEYLKRFYELVELRKVEEENRNKQGIITSSLGMANRTT
jgi:hypothetical protein